jgi:sec-independent protein translocase protein TatA
MKEDAVPFGIGPLELVVILLILLLVFGAKRLPEIGRSIGSSAREFKHGITGEKDQDDGGAAGQITGDTDQADRGAVPGPAPDGEAVSGPTREDRTSR